MKTQTANNNAEGTGHTHTREWYIIHSREVGTDKWYGSLTERYDSVDEARKTMRELTRPYIDMGGGFGMRIKGNPVKREYRVLKVVAQFTVEHEETLATY